MANGSTIVNYPTGYTVLRNDYVGSTFNNILQMMNIQQSVLPCIYNGLQVSMNTGLIVTVSTGFAQGQNIEFTQSVNSPFLPTNVGLAVSTNVTCTDNSTGWIVLNVNITPGPTVLANQYAVATDDGTGSNPVPVFVTSLSPSVGTSYPYTQIVLAQVVTLGGVVTSISTSTGNRSFDWSTFLSSASGLTGDVKQSYNPNQPSGWIQMNDGSIGSAASGATTLASAVAQNLYELLWNQIPDVWCPVAGGRGLSASADFTANKALLLPATVGRALCNSGTATLNQTFTVTGSVLTVPTTSSLYYGTPVTVSSTGTLPSPLVAATTYYVIQLSGTTLELAATTADVNSGTPITLTTTGTGTLTITVNYSAYIPGQIVGEEAHQILTSELADHVHVENSSQAGGSQFGADGITTAHNVNATFYSTGSTGGDDAHNNIQPSTFIPVWIHI